jgi:hypothetical protein
MRKIRAVIQAALCIAMAALPPLAMGQSPQDGFSVDTKAGYARILFTFKQPTPVKASIADGVLTIEFGRAVDTTVDSLVESLGAYVSVGRRTDDGRVYRLALKDPIGLHVSTQANRTAVDLLPGTFKGTPPDLPRPPPPLRKQQPEIASLPVVKLQAVEYADFTRLIFDWPKAVRYSARPEKGRISVRFEPMARPDFSVLESRPAPWVKSARWRPEGEATLVEIETDAEAGFRDSKDGFKVTIDVLAPKTDASAFAFPSANGSPRPLTTPPSAKGGAPGTPLRPSVASAPAPTASVTAPQATPALPAPSAELIRDGAALRFPAAHGRAAAVFSRGETLWIVLDNHPAIDAASLLAPLAGLLAKAEAVEVQGAAVLRLNFRTPHLPSVSDSETALVVSLSTSNATPPAAISLSRQGAEGQMTLIASLPGASRVLALDDNEAGDRILITPANAGRGMLTTRRLVELMVLPSAAGLAVIPYADDIQATVRDGTVRFARPQGLALSAGSGAAAGPTVQIAESKEGPAFVDFAQWSQPGSNVLATIKSLRTQVARLPESESGRTRLQLARYLLANELAPEALGEITLMQAEDARLQSDPALQAMKGVAQFMMGRYGDARLTLSLASLTADPHAALWRGMAEAKLSDHTNARRDLQTSQSVLRLYPVAWQARARLARAETGLAQGDLATAHDALDQLASVLGPREALEAELLRAQLLAAQGHVNEAVARLRALERANMPPLPVKAAFARIEAELNAKKLKPTDAIEALETLRYRWRGDDLELRMLRKLGSLYFAESRWREGLDVLRSAAVNFPGTELARDAQDDMRAAFNELFLGSTADSMVPVQALALFNDFIELTPIGREGDEMIRRLTERLVAIDLLAPAEELLEHQVYRRLEGVARSVVATQLATIYLLDSKPREALKTLNDTRLTRLPDEINQRRRLLEARALAGLKQFDSAADLLAQDASPEARRLRADIAWESGNWRLAGARNEELLGNRAAEGGPLTPEERAQVMRAAVAYSRAGDGAALQRLRSRYAAKMNDSPDARAFSVVTGTNEQQGVAFQDLAKSIAAVDTLQGLMDDLKKQAPAASPN